MQTHETLQKNTNVSGFQINIVFFLLHPVTLPDSVKSNSRSSLITVHLMVDIFKKKKSIRN